MGALALRLRCRPRRVAHARAPLPSTTPEVLQRATVQLLPAGALRLRVNITDVVRPAADVAPGSAPVYVTYSQRASGNEPAVAARTLACGALINTVAQALPNMGYLRLDDVERELFSRIYWCRYDVACDDQSC